MRGSTTYRILTDHLKTPRKLIDASNATVWSWDGKEAFGDTPPTGSLTFNLRFPGQYADVETGLVNNGFRDYDPAWGRYLESDPIGLNGGLNTYGYVEGNPINMVDIFGEAPGDKYRTIADAGQQAIIDIEMTSIKNNVEYAGRIYEVTTDKYPYYTYTAPRMGGHDWSMPGSCPAGTIMVGRYHTHGGYDKFLDSENFSKQDIYNADSERVPSFLGTPDGYVKVYIPDIVFRSGGASVIYGDGTVSILGRLLK